jgi:hypothetical protein
MKNFKKKIFWIDPNKLNHFSPPPNWWWYARLEKRIKVNYLKRFIKYLAMGDLLYGGNWDLNPISFAETDWCMKIRNINKNLLNIEDSQWYISIIEEIKRTGFYKHKDIKMSNIDEVKKFFKNYILKIVKSLKQNGYLIQDASSDDLPKALIGRHGELIKSGNGCHRLAIIKYFNIDCLYPVQIVAIHKNFYQKKKFNEKKIENFILKNYS